MNPDQFGPKSTGKLVLIKGVHGASHAFMPDPLPADFEFPESLYPLLISARESLARVDGIGMHLPNPGILLRPLQNREAQRSSSLEGTHTDPQQLLIFQADPEAKVAEEGERDAYREVANYRRALEIGSELNRELPISLRLIRNLHAVLMSGVRGENKEPGQFRRLHVHVGNPPRYVPPPHQTLDMHLDTFEKYLHAEKILDPLVEAFVAHYQFEAIHPFRDGNGRVGRLLLSLTIAEWCQLSDQWLYMSAFFERNRDEYIDRLFRVSTQGDWAGWIEFCLHGVVEQARDTRRRFDRLLELLQDYKQRLQVFPRASSRLPAIVDALFETPLLHLRQLQNHHDVTWPTAKSDVDKLRQVGILSELDGVKGKYGRTYYFAPEIFGITWEDV